MSGRAATIRTPADFIGARIPIALAFACLLCGALMSVKVTVVGEVFVGEALLLVTAFVTLFLRGVGRCLPPWFLWTFAGLGMLMLMGYLASDLVAVTASSQYLRGWARTVLFGADVLSILIVVSHGERTLRWLVVGLVVGQLAKLIVVATPMTMITWKTGYGFPIGLLAALLAGYLPPLLAALLLGGIGVTSIQLDFRSLGGILLLAAAFITTRAEASWHRLSPLMRGSAAMIASLVTLGAIGATLTQSEADYHLRRLESNAGRFSGMLIAAEAIADSPLLGYGSWAENKQYARMVRQEFNSATKGTEVSCQFGDSILPHSQLLQVWVEGGILAAAFFLVLGANLLRALLWLILHHRLRPMSALYSILAINGLWDLMFSPFLGSHRISVAYTLAALALLAAERALDHQCQAKLRVGLKSAIR